jgi:uncharacterized membrane protein YdjX (TVP38/TMEM64 family)
MKKRTKIILQFIFFLIILVGATIIFWKPLTQLLSNAEDIREFIRGFGILAPVIFIVIVILQVLLAPIPGQVAGLAGGYTFGIILGTVYSMIGLILGSFIAFSLSRKFGRPFVEKVINKKTLNKYDKIISKKGLPVLFLIYLLPTLPDDAICYIAGLTKIKIRALVIISAIGRFPGFLVLSVVGTGLASKNTLFSVILFMIMMIVSIIIYLNRNKLENRMIKIIKKLKHNLPNKNEKNKL